MKSRGRALQQFACASAPGLKCSCMLLQVRTFFENMRLKSATQ